MLTIILWNPYNCGIGRRLFDFSYAFKQSDEHETQQVCALYRYILLNNLNCNPIMADGGVCIYV